MNRLLVATLLALGGCGHPVGGQDAGADLSFAGAFAPHDKVDILFVLADFTILPKRQELVNRFPQLVTALQNFAAQGKPASYHIGVISTDLGAGPFTYNAGQCHPDGDGGKLQVGPDPTTVETRAAIRRVIARPRAGAS